MVPFGPARLVHLRSPPPCIRALNRHRPSPQATPRGTGSQVNTTAHSTTLSSTEHSSIVNTYPTLIPIQHGVINLLKMSRRNTIDEDMSDNPNPPNGIPERFQDSPASFLTQGESPAFGAPPRRQNSSTLPEDDGMKALRKKIIQIQISTATPEEKAKFMHELLTEGYTQSQISQTIKPSSAPDGESAHTPPLIKQQRPGTPTSTKSFNFWAGTTPGHETVEFHLTPSDLAPTYAPLPESDGSMEVHIKDEDRALGCEHYKRNVKLQCAVCQKWYTCRLCHDAKEDHILPRKLTKNMLCMLCETAQKASDQCTHCQARSANYYCDVCHLWEDDPNRSIYHCNDCGICRVGRGLGKDFIHCKVLAYPLPLSPSSLKTRNRCL